jgi:23S rRNA pseudouridine1911/1915/1917 synthase
VHRLDKDTSGALLIAKHDKAHQMLSAQFKARTLCKVYAALAVGRFAVPQGRVDAPIARDGKDRKRMAVVAGGRPAATLYRVAMQWPQAALLKLRLVTGRTHQIRVHMRHLGHPLAGDAIYGDRRAAPTVPRLMLHARSITFTHPITDERLRVEAPWPQDFLTVLQKLSNPAETAALAEAFAGFDTLQVLDGLAE